MAVTMVNAKASKMFFLGMIGFCVVMQIGLGAWLFAVAELGKDGIGDVEALV